MVIRLEIGCSLVASPALEATFAHDENLQRLRTQNLSSFTVFASCCSCYLNDCPEHEVDHYCVKRCLQWFETLIAIIVEYNSPDETE